MYTCQYPRAAPDMHGTQGCSIIQYMALMLLVLHYSVLLLLQHGQICPLSCKPMCFVGQYCTQMVQLTRLHNLHKTSLLLIDVYDQTSFFFFLSMATIRGNQTSSLVPHHDLICLLDFHILTINMGLSLAFDEKNMTETRKKIHRVRQNKSSRD